MTTGASNQAVRWLVIGVLSVATAGMVLVSLRANYLFGYGFGQSEDKARVFGWANVAADLWKVTGLIVLMALWRARHWRTALSLAPLWVLCLGWGMAGAVGVYAQDRTALIGGREARVTTYKERAAQLQELDRKLSKAAATRSVAEVDAAIETIFVRPLLRAERVFSTVGRLSAQCTNGDRRVADACADVAALREERAAAERSAELERGRATLQGEVDRLREGGATTVADPVAELFAWLSRGQLSVRDIEFGFPLAFAFLVELVSALGPAAVVAYAEATHAVRDWQASKTQPDIARHGVLKPGEAWQESEGGSLVAWLAERAVPSDEAAAISINELHADYQAWCAEKRVPGLARQAFAEDFDRVRDMPEMAGKIRKFGTRYYGIRLVNYASLIKIGNA